MRIPSICLLSALLVLPTSGFSLGFRLADMDAFATGRSDAFAATADNPSAVYYNPAGITQLEGMNMRMGVYGIGLNDQFDPEAKGGKPVETTTGIQAVPTTFVTLHPENKPFAVGYGVYAPYGLAINWPNNSQFRTLGLGGKVAFIAVNPVAALQVSRTFSIGAGLTINHVDTTLRQGISAPGDLFKFRGSGVAVGFTAGALWQPLPQHSFGLTYHSGITVGLSGHTSIRLSDSQRSQIRAANAMIAQTRKAFGAAGDAALLAQGLPLNGFPDHFPEADADADLHFPQFIIAGYSFRPTPDWNFEFDVDWTDWDSLNSVTLHQQRMPNTEIPFNYTSSFIWEFGVTRYFAHGLHGSLGYMYSENSVSESNFNPGVPDSDRHLFTAGIGQKSGRYSWDLAYQFAYGPTRTIDNNNLSDGTYRFRSHAITLALGYHF